MAGTVLGVAAGALRTRFGLVQMHAEPSRSARMVPLTVDGLIYANSMLDSAHRKVSETAGGLGIGATLAGNVAHSLGHGLVGGAVAAWSTWR